MKQDVNILTTLNLSNEAQERLQEVSKRIKFTFTPASNPAEVIDEVWADTEVLFTGGVLPDPAIAPNLRWVQFASAGVDSFIDHPIVKKTDVIATTMSGVITSQIAEYILMAILAFGQKLPNLLRFQKNRHWPKEAVKREVLNPVELRFSTVGLLGYGSIGRQVARLLQPFGASVLAVKKDVMHPGDTGYIRDGAGDPHGDFFDRLYPIEALHSFLESSDFVVLTLPLTESTRNILDAEAFKKMKTSAYLVNVGRGQLIDQEALVKALGTKQIAGAALDVFTEEPLPENSPLWDMENVIISPHVAGVSEHFMEDILKLFIENLNRYLEEVPLYNQVNLEEGY